MADKEMEVLLAEKEIKVGEQDVIVKRIALLDTLRIATKVSDVVSRVINSTNDFNLAMAKVLYSGREGEQETDESINAIKMTGIIELIGIAGDEATELLKLIIDKSTNLSKDEIENIDSYSGIDLIEAIYEVNKGFFKKCMSKLKEKMASKKDSKKMKSK